MENYTMKRWLIVIILLFTTCCLVSSLFGQSIYDLRKLTEQDWLNMSTEERLNAIGMANKQAKDKTFPGNFGTNYELCVFR